MASTATLFERLGGEATVEAAVVRFYDKVMSDPSLAPFFAGFDMAAQIHKQIAFMTLAFGGPTSRSTKDLRAAHAGLVARGLADSHFDATTRHLRDTLVEIGVQPSVMEEVLAIVSATRPQVLGR